MAYQKASRRDIESEMNRFEQEISSVSAVVATPPVSYNANQMHLSHTKPQSMQFIPHQLQRQPQPTSTMMAPRSVAMGYTAAQSYPSRISSATIQATPSLPPPPPPPPLSVPASYTAIPQMPVHHNAYSSATNYTVTPMGLPSHIHTVPSTSNGIPGSANSSSSSANTDSKKKAPKSNEKSKKQKKFLRVAGGQTWEDQTLQEWEADDFRIFCGDLGNDVNNEILSRAFSKYPSFLKSKVVRDKRTNKTKGYGFVSFKDPEDFIRAMREMNGKYVGSRPIKLRKSCWRDRGLDMVKKKNKEKQKLGLL